MSEFDFQILYKKGKLDTQAEALSRLTTHGETTSDLDEDIPCFSIDREYDEGYEVDFIEEEFAYDDALLTTETGMSDPDLLAAITLEELVLAQESDAFCKVIRSRLNGGDDLPFAVDDRGFLSRYVEAFPQIVIPQTLKPRVLYISHHAKLAAHRGGRKMYATLRRFLYWPSMAVDVYVVPRNCVSCAKNRISLRKLWNFLKLFPARAPLEFVAIDILGELIKTPRGNCNMLVISDRFSKLVRTVPLKTVTASEVAKAFVHHWVFPYGAPIWLLSDNGKQFIAKLFRETCLKGLSSDSS